MHNIHDFLVKDGHDTEYSVFTQHSAFCTDAVKTQWQNHANAQSWVAGLNIRYDDFLNDDRQTLLFVTKNDDAAEKSILGSAIISNTGTELYLTGEFNWQNPNDPNIPLSIATAFLESAIHICQNANGPTRVSCVTFAAPHNHGTFDALYQHPDFYFVGVDGHSPAALPVAAYRYRKKMGADSLPTDMRDDVKKIELALRHHCLG